VVSCDAILEKYLEKTLKILKLKTENKKLKTEN
jgi:hypothetical protein